VQYINGVVHLGLSQGKAGPNTDDRIARKMVVQLLLYYALRCPSKLLIC